MTLNLATPQPISILSYPMTATTQKRRIHAINLTMKEFEPVRTATALRIQSSGTVDRTFALTQMASVVKTLDDCVLDLRKVWNLPVNGEARKVGDVPPIGHEIRPTPEKLLGAYFNSDDYPAVAIRQEGSGVVKVVMLIDEKGIIATCNVIEVSGLASLDAQTCAILKKRAKFRPGVDVSGKPVKSGTTMTIRWQLPE